MESDRRFAGDRVDMVAGLIVLGVDAVAGTSLVARASDIRLGVKWSWVVLEKTD